MERLEGCDDRAFALTDDHLEVLRWSSVQNQFLVSDLDFAKLVRDDRGRTLGLFGKPEERVRLSFGRLAATIWVPLERQSEAESFAAKVDAAIRAAGGDGRGPERDGT